MLSAYESEGIADDFHQLFDEADVEVSKLQLKQKTADDCYQLMNQKE
jgi:hypothetical protein